MKDMLQRHAPQIHSTPEPVYYDDDQDGFDLPAIVAVFRRRIGIFLATLILIFTAVTVTTFQLEPQYTATASVMIDVREKEFADIDAVLSGISSDAGAIDTEVEIIKSRALAEQVVDKFDLINDPEFNPSLLPDEGGFDPIGTLRGFISSLVPKAPAPGSNVAQSEEDIAFELKQDVVQALQDRLKVSRLGRTLVINISIESNSPQKAAQLANAFADEYLYDQLEAKYDATNRANEWLNERLGSLREEVRAAESAVEIYRAQSGLLSAQGSSLTEQQISDFNAQLVIQRAEFEEAQARLNSVRAQLARGNSAETIGEVLSSSVISSLRSQQAEVTRRRAELASRYGQRHPEIIKVQREIADISTQIDQEVRRIVSSLESEVDVARQKVRSLEGSLSGLRGQLSSNNRSLVRLRELEREAEATRTLYESFLSRFKETGEQEAITEADARIISPAIVPKTQSSPNTLRNLIMGLFLGGALGVALIYVLEMFDRGINTGDQIEKQLGVPYLTSIPTVTGSLRKRLANLLPSDADSSEKEPAKKLPWDYLVDNPLSGFAEAFRTLRSAILLANVDVTPKTVAITSALPGDGKTTSALCLGRLSAMSGSKVVILDCDIRRKSLSKIVAPDAEKGLVHLLEGSVTKKAIADLLIKDSRSDCSILPVGDVDHTPADIFGSDKFTKLLESLSNQFDLVVIDTAPVLPVAETRTIASKADAVIVTARWRKTKIDAVKTALEAIDSVGARIVGVALTQVNPTARARYGYGDSGYYYGSYRKYYSG